MARPPTYSAKAYDAKCEALAAEGWTDWQIAKRLGTTSTSFKNWKEQHPSFLAALEKGRDRMLENLPPTLYRKAFGYEYDEVSVTIEEIVTAKPGTEKAAALDAARERREDGEHIYAIKRTTTTKRAAPDTAMSIFLAVNKLGGDYRHVNRVEHTGQDGEPIRIINDVPDA
ncbi:MAG: hypothetical protein U1E29_05550 [Coriobacteriia bacterium]|nr:hypothetical protein [Coriobacteriia bacterium]